MEAECTSRPTRRERQRDSIAIVVAAGDLVRATALASEHIAEFPEDETEVQALLAPD